MLILTQSFITGITGSPPINAVPYHRQAKAA